MNDSRQCRFCGGALTGRQRTTCGECRKTGARMKGKRPSGYARLTEDQREDRAQQRVSDRREAATERAYRPCAGVDGEGHDGAYFLLAAASDDGFHREVWSDHPQGLSTLECFGFLCDLPDHFVYWGFSFGYDVNMMLRDVPIKRLERLHESGWLAWGPYKMHWVPGKLLQISRSKSFDWQTGKRGPTERTIRVWDMYPWQGQSFVAWLKENGLGDAGTFPVLEYMKQVRPDFKQADREEITAYCLEECRLLSRGAGRVHGMLADTGLRLSTFHSPATVSKAMMRANGVEACMSKQAPVPAEIAGWADRAYFGGRAETTTVGPVDGPLYLHDIRSAYPTAMLQLPCLAHGRWVEGGEGPWSLLDVSWNVPGALWGPLPIRPRVGSLKWPTKGRGWLWAPEVEGIEHLARIKVHRRVSWQPECDHHPFSYIGDLYAERAALKALGDPRQYVLKIALNASYGATAEHRRRGMKHEPRWREPVWAGWITAFTRGMIGAQLGPDVVMVATDGILTRRPLDVPVGTALGEWEVDEYERGFVVGPGVYFLYRNGRWSKFKSRGINARAFKVEDFQHVWETQGREGVLPIAQTRFVGLGTALHRIRGMEPPGERMWRKFIDFTPARSLSLVPRRRWLTDDEWDGRSLAPTPGTMAAAERDDLTTSYKLERMLSREPDPERRTRLYMALSGISDVDGDGREFFLDTDQPWN